MFGISSLALHILLFRLQDMKGPKHQTRLRAVRGYFVDEKSIALPMKTQCAIKLQKRSDHFEPECYGIQRCEDNKNPKLSLPRRAHTIVCKSLDFVD